MRTKSTQILFFLLILLVSNHTTLHAQSPTISTYSGMPVDKAGKGIAYGAGVYVAIYMDGTIIRSTDGAHWAEVMYDPNQSGLTLNSIAYGNGHFVVVGNDGLLLISPDGINWEFASAGTWEQLNQVKYENSTFYIVGARRTLVKSSDLVNWTAITVAPAAAEDNFIKVEFSPTSIVVGARKSSAARIYRATYGVENDWALAYSHETNSLNNVQYLNDKFYQFTSQGRIWTSPNGTSWTDATASMSITLPNNASQAVTSPNQIFHGIYDGSRYLFFGNAGYFPGYGNVFTSTDGTNLTLETRTVSFVSQGATYINNQFWHWGNEGFVVSNDGVNYKYLNAHLYSVARSTGGTLVAVGGVGNYSTVMTSSNFSEWTNTTTGLYRDINSVIYGGGQFLAVGSGVVQASTDGTNWTTLATPIYNFKSVTYSDGSYVAVATRDGYPNTYFLSSIDGVDWVTEGTSSVIHTKIRSTSNGDFIAVGYHKDTYVPMYSYSTNGRDWASFDIPQAPDAYAYYDVAYNGSKYVIVGTDWLGIFMSMATDEPGNPNSWTRNPQQIATSEPGLELGAWFGEMTVASSSGRFVGAVGNVMDGRVYVIESTDGINWTGYNTGAYFYAFDILANNDRYYLVGTGGYSLMIDYGSTLPVQLTNFSVRAANGDALLTWKTASEQNSREFRIQHSTDGTNWHQLGVVAAAGNSEQTRTYQYKHISPSSGTHFYRLVQVDIDGRSTLSDVRKLVIAEKSSFTIYPNPTSGNINLQRPTVGRIQVSVIGTNGNLVYNATHTGNIISIPSSSWRAGLYKIRIVEDGKVEVVNFLKQ